MHEGARRWILSAALLSAAAFALLNVLAYNQAKAMLRFTDGDARTPGLHDRGLLNKMSLLLTGVRIPRPAGRGRAADLSDGCRELLIAAPDGPTLSSWYCDRGAQTPLVLLFHGYKADKTALRDEARSMLDLGASVLLLDFRGSGGSSEAYTTIGFHEGTDVAATFRYAQDRLPHDRILLFGQSMGAAAILRAIHVHRVAPDGIILEAPFDSLLNTVRHRFHALGIPAFPSAQLLVFWGGRQWGFNGFSHNPADYAASVRSPALLMHGALDRRVTLDEARRVFDALGGRKRFVVFDGAGHESYLARDAARWRGAIREILQGEGIDAPGQARSTAKR